MSLALNELFQVIRDRQKNAPAGSYTAALMAGGPEAIAKKVGEEAIEVIVAVHAEGRERLIEESADLLYHLLVLLAASQIDLADIETELGKRRNR